MNSNELEKIRQRVKEYEDLYYRESEDDYDFIDNALYDIPALIEEIEYLRRIYVYARVIVNIKDTVSISGKGTDHMHRALSDLHEELENGNKK